MEFLLDSKAGFGNISADNKILYHMSEKFESRGDVKYVMQTKKGKQHSLNVQSVTFFYVEIRVSRSFTGI